jgi:hypothetical protein
MTCFFSKKIKKGCAIFFKKSQFLSKISRKRPQNGARNPQIWLNYTIVQLKLERVLTFDPSQLLPPC